MVSQDQESPQPSNSRRTKGRRTAGQRGWNARTTLWSSLLVTTLLIWTQQHALHSAAAATKMWVSGHQQHDRYLEDTDGDASSTSPTPPSMGMEFPTNKTLMAMACPTTLGNYTLTCTIADA